MPKAQAALIEAENLAAAYGQKNIWEGANFKVKTGQFVGVLGPNGAGKTTLFRLLLGLLPPAAGRLEVFGRRPGRGDNRIGYVPQRHLIDKDMRLEALELVKLGLDGRKWGIPMPAQAARTEKIALKALNEVGAAELAHQPLGLLSGGELQRVFIAQALAGQPKLLLLDEPLANLDIRRQTALVTLIAGLAKSHEVGVLLIAHDINPLLSAMDSVIYMANGRIATGQTDDVISSKVLTKLYDAPVEVLRDSRGRIAVLGAEEAAHPHE